MRKTTLCVLMIFLILAAVPGRAAVNLSIGATGGSIWWNPSWADGKNLVRYSYMNPLIVQPPKFVLLEDARDFGREPDFMGGGMVSLGFLERWSLSSVFLIGRYSFRKAGFSNWALLSQQGAMVLSMLSANPMRVRRDCMKWDSDSSLGFSINRFFKVFAGLKVQGYEYDQDLLMYNNSIFSRKLNNRVTGYGPGLGVGLTVPIVENLYMAATFSGLAVWSTEHVDVTRSFGMDATGTVFVYVPLYTPKGRSFSYGCNSTLNLGYHIAKINTTVQVGGRYQLLYNRQKFRNAFNNDVSFNIVDKQYDHFFGVTMSVIYTFHIGKKEDKS